MQTRTPAQRGGAWLAQCMRDVKAQRIQQVVRSCTNGGGDALPVRSVVATSRIHRGERIGTVKRECVLTGGSAAELLRQTCRGGGDGTSATASSSDAQLRALSTQTFDGIVSRLSHLQQLSSTPPYLLLSRDALLMTIALYIARSPVHQGVLPTTHPMHGWMEALPRRAPPMGVLLHNHLARDAGFEPLTRRLRLGRQTREVHAGESEACASTELMVQAVESGEVELTELTHPTVETALTTSVLTNYFKGRTSALTIRQHETKRARSGAVEREEDAVHLFLAWESHLQTLLVTTLLPVLLTSPSAPCPLPAGVIDSTEWQAEEAVLRWAHFMLRSRAVNLNWRQQGPPQLSLIPLVDMLNHGAHKANVVYHCEANGDVTLTASQSIQAGEELVLRYNHIGQRGCLFGDQPRTVTVEAEPVRRVGRAMAAAAREVEKIEKRQYRELYARDEDEEAVLSPGTMAATLPDGSSSSLATSPISRTRSPQEQQAASLAHAEMQQEVQWLWRYGFLRSTDEKNREAAQLWSRDLRSRIAHLTDVRRKGRPGEFVVGVPEGLQHLREQRAQLERERYANHRVFPPQQP